ncbi:MAG: hypothetical protein R3F61_14750 [Myxococcota bacterium]
MPSRQSSFAVIADKDVAIDRLVRALKAAGAGADVVVESDPALGIARVHESPIAVFTTVGLLDDTLATMGRDRWRVFVLNDKPEEKAFEVTLSDSRIGGLLAWGSEGGRAFELRYLARRLLAPNEPPPHMGALLGWGATTMSFKPKTTTEERAVVSRIEIMGRKLGLSGRWATSLSSAAHELMMNAIYDAPVDEHGQLKYALRRDEDIQLLPQEVPTLWFTLSADFIALDMIDPFGRLPRNRFYEGVLRGHRNLKYQRNELDTSHGGAGLGLHTLYTSGSILRAELQPLKLTHVSWVLDRQSPKSGFRELPRSLYFLPYRPDR